MSETEESDDSLYWAKPLDARRYHIFDGFRSLCGNWAMTNQSGDHDPVDPDQDDFRDGKDCKTCSRKAGVLES